MAKTGGAMRGLVAAVASLLTFGTLTAASTPAEAATTTTLTWTGAAASAASQVVGNWSDPGNWSPNAIPAAGDNLVFPVGLGSAPEPAYNDMTGLVVDSISMLLSQGNGCSSYSAGGEISGNPVGLTGNVYGAKYCYNAPKGSRRI